jgi:hypothetical protein
MTRNDSFVSTFLPLTPRGNERQETQYAYRLKRTSPTTNVRGTQKAFPDLPNLSKGLSVPALTDDEGRRRSRLRCMTIESRTRVLNRSMSIQKVVIPHPWSSAMIGSRPACITAQSHFFSDDLTCMAVQGDRMCKAIEPREYISH